MIAPRALRLQVPTLMIVAASIGAIRAPSRLASRAPGNAATQWSQVSAGAYGNCALDAVGKAFCWGADFGRESGGTVFNRTPKPVPTPIRFSTVTVGGSMACGLSVDGPMYCWGSAIESSLGDGLTRVSSAPVRVSMPGVVTQISAGAPRVCGLDAVGTVHCWGEGLKAFRPDSNEFFVVRPSPVRSNVRFQQVSVGSTQVCAVDVSDDAYCWGYGYGSIGIGARDTSCMSSSGCIDVDHPQRVVGDLKWSQVSAGNGFTCGVTRDARGYCWGDVLSADDPYGSSGTLGRGELKGSPAPVAVTGGLRFIAIHAGTRHACGLTTDSVAVCCGINSTGQLGIGRADAGVYRPGGRGRYPSPQRVLGGLQFTSVAVGENSCGITIGRELFCWGDNSRGMLGTGRGGAHETAPARVTEPGR